MHIKVKNLTTSHQYAKHLPQIGEILEFLAMEAKKFEQYLDYLHCLLDLCCKPLLLQRSSELLDVNSKLQRYFSLLGYLLVLAPTKRSFYAVKLAIETLVSNEDLTRCCEKALKPEIRHEAVEQSRLPLTLAELTEAASSETYPAVLQLSLAVASVSRTCCTIIIHYLSSNWEKINLIKVFDILRSQDVRCWN